MKFILVVFTISAALLYGCSGNQGNANFNKDALQTSGKDSLYYAIFKFDTTQTWIFPSNCRPTDINQQDIELIQKLLKEYIEIYNKNQRKEFESNKTSFMGEEDKIENYLINLKNYKQQFVPVINPQGEKEVWVNCICSGAAQDWRKEIINVKDGGNCFFNIKVNLNQKKCYYLVVTGVS